MQEGGRAIEKVIMRATYRNTEYISNNNNALRLSDKESKNS